MTADDSQTESGTLGDRPPDRIEDSDDGGAGATDAGPAQAGARPEPGPGGTDFSLEYPTQIGSYKILDVLGVGGMAVVFLAEQTEPVRRRVALKMVKLGMDTKQVLARFESEKQALALLDHPNIAKVFDGGVTESGRPYFVMELVHGVPITEYADTHRLGPEDRIRLFMDLCNGVQHAHQKGIIHRDVKPSNVLVLVQTDRPMPKIIDFGIAKAVSGAFTEQTLVTRIGQMVGTPEYMSPEQAEATELDVDTRTDVYSLGVLLYELLVGALPFEVGSRPDFAIPYVLRTDEIPRPSTRLTKLGEAQASVAALRGTTPRELKKTLQGDLDWIILKAMDKDRTRRYETAHGLLVDLERSLNDEPVRARPPSTGYRVRKFVRRHRAGVAAAAVAVVAVIWGGAAATVGMIRAQEAQARAEVEAATAERVSDFMVDLFAVNDPGETRGNTVTAREILDRGAERIERELANEPLVQARMLRTVGEVYTALGLYEEAAPLLQRAVTLEERVPGAPPQALASSLSELGGLYMQQGRFEAAEAVFRRSLALRREVLGPRSGGVASLHSNLGAVLMQQGRLDEAGPLLREAITIHEESGQDQDALARAIGTLGLLHWLGGDYAEAEPLLERQLVIEERLHGEDDPGLGATLNNLGALYWQQGKYDEAATVYARAREILESALGPEHPNVARALNNLAETYWAEGSYRTAEEHFLQALAIKEERLEPDHPDVAVTLNGLANVYRDQGDFERAEPLYRRALSIRQGGTDRRLAETVNDFARMLREAGRPDEAERLEALFREQLSG